MFSEAIENFRKDRDVKLEPNEKRRHGLVSEHSYYELGFKNYELLKLIRSKLLWKKYIYISGLFRAQILAFGTILSK